MGNCTFYFAWGEQTKVLQHLRAAFIKEMLEWKCPGHSNHNTHPDRTSCHPGFKDAKELPDYLQCTRVDIQVHQVVFDAFGNHRPGFHVMAMTSWRLEDQWDPFVTGNLEPRV